MKNILIIVCSGTYNRGTEALVRGTSILLEKAYGEVNITLSSSTPLEDSKICIPHVSTNIPRLTYPQRLSLRHLRYKIYKIINRHYLDYSNLVKHAQHQDLVLVVGADNYDVAYNLFDGLHQLNCQLKRESEGKLFLYDCSLNRESITDRFIREAQLFDAFSVREKETLANLSGKYDGNNLHYFPDPAFVMPSKEVQLPTYWKENNMVGVNLSTLIVGNNYGENLRKRVISAYKVMIDRIIGTTPFDIVLIPHVMHRMDLSILEEIKAIYPKNDRVHLISDETLTAPELKWIISHFRFFVGARTHATIAAYSSCVPTLVLGYSTKSIGIAKDLFGSVDEYVLPITNLCSEDKLWEMFSNIMLNEVKIKKMLQKRIPLYQNEVYSMVELFQNLL